MKKILISLSLSLGLLFSPELFAQVVHDTVMERFCGNYNGMLNIFGKNGKVDEVPMALQISVIKPDSVWQWKITYGSGEDADIRDYELHAVDTARNYAYVLDEKDGIKLSFYFISRVFYCFFDVDGTWLYSSYGIGKDRINVQMITSNPLRSDFETLTPEGSHVRSYPLTGVQQAILRKQ